MSEELKPCPFCGQNANVSCEEFIPHWWVECVACDATLSRRKEDSAVAAWNTRPIEDALRAELATARVHYEKLYTMWRQVAILLGGVDDENVINAVRVERDAATAARADADRLAEALRETLSTITASSVTELYYSREVAMMQAALAALDAGKDENGGMI